jgi:hypothetical protein
MSLIVNLGDINLLLMCVSKLDFPHSLFHKFRNVNLEEDTHSSSQQTWQREDIVVRYRSYIILIVTFGEIIHLQSGVCEDCDYFVCMSKVGFPFTVQNLRNSVS